MWSAEREKGPVATLARCPSVLIRTPTTSSVPSSDRMFHMKKPPCGRGSGYSAQAPHPQREPQGGIEKTPLRSSR